MKRIFLGLLVAVAVYAVTSTLASPLGTAAYGVLPQGAYIWALAVVWAMPVLLGVFFGAVVAGGRFMAPALILWAVPIVYVLQWGYALQQPARQMDLLTFLGSQFPSLLLGLAAAVIGAWFGGKAAAKRRQKPNNSSKPTPLRGAA